MLKYIKVNGNFLDFVLSTEDLKEVLKKVRYHFKNEEDIEECINSFRIFFEEDPAFKIEEMTYQTKENQADISIIIREELKGYNSELSIGILEEIFPKDWKELSSILHDFIDEVSDELNDNEEYLFDYGVSIKGDKKSLSDALLITEGSGGKSEEVEVNGTKYIISYSFDN